jgi:hypothetical protein
LQVFATTDEVYFSDGFCANIDDPFPFFPTVLLKQLADGLGSASPKRGRKNNTSQQPLGLRFLLPKKANR